MRDKLPRNKGIAAGGVAQTEADHFVKCPGCNQRLDMRDLVQAFGARPWCL